MQQVTKYDVVPADEFPEESGMYFIEENDRPMGRNYYRTDKGWDINGFTHWLRPRTYYVVDGVSYESEQQAREKIGAHWDACEEFLFSPLPNPDKDEYIQLLIDKK